MKSGRLSLLTKDDPGICQREISTKCVLLQYLSLSSKDTKVELEKSIWDYHNPYEWLRRVRNSSFPPLIICVAISGGVHGKEANPNLPETPDEQVEQTYAAYQAGASMVHVHVRDPQKWWDGSDSVKQYRKVNSMIREACPDIIINNTTGGSFGMTVEQRLTCLDAKPEIATLNMGPDMYKTRLKERKPPLPHPRPAVNMEGIVPVTYEEIRTFAAGMKDRGIKPEMEVYQPGQLWSFNELVEHDLIKPPYLIQFVTGYMTNPWATPRNLINAIEQLPSEVILEISGVGPFQTPMTTLGIIMGAGIIRVGLEDNVYAKRGQLLKNNAEAVEKVVRIAGELNRAIATRAQAREMLGISREPGQY
jgi:3-keto-5-aminohexanoate cleavage enzyme